jgi:hypothetical protein
MLDHKTVIDGPSGRHAPDPPGNPAQIGSPLSSSIHLRRSYFWRPQDWRWQRAEFLLRENEYPSDDRDDEFVEVALDFLQADHGSSEPPACKCLLPSETRAAIQSAKKIHERNDVDTWTLQAWLLTGEPFEVISGETPVSVDEIVWYTRLFFDVQDRLYCPSFITHRVIGPKIHYGLSAQDVDVIWRAWAYNGGRYILQSLLDDFIETGRDDYGYLVDGTYRNADLPLERLLLHQAIRVQLLSLEDVTKMLFRALKDPGIAARGGTIDEFIQSLVTPDIDCSSAETGGEPAVPVTALREVVDCKVDMAGAA